MFAALDGLMARHKVNIDEVYGYWRSEGESIVASVREGKVKAGEGFSEIADDRAIEAEFEAAGRVLSPDIARKYADTSRFPMGMMTAFWMHMSRLPLWPRSKVYRAISTAKPTL